MSGSSAERARDGRTQQLLERRRATLASSYRLFYSSPVHVVRGEGVWLFDATGDQYLDAYNNVACVGHSHPRVVAAMAEQAGRLNTHTRYLTDETVDYAERLLTHFAAPLDRVVFTCTGSEANDLAYRMARAATGGEGFIVTDNAYHGVSAVTAGMSPSLGLGVAAFVRTVPPPTATGSGRDPGEEFGARVRDAAEQMAAAGVRPAALIFDTVFASDGVIAGPPGLLRPAAEEIRRAGGVLIADEVQAGFGRLGDGMWGYDRHGVRPDIVTLGKPMGNGYPIAGLVSSESLMSEFGSRARYFNTFGGNAVACATASAVLDVIENDQLIANAMRVGTRLRRAIADLAARHPAVADVRGSGLFIGVELAPEGAAGPSATDAARVVVDGLRDRRVLIGTAGPSANVLKIRPPLPFSDANADQLLEALDGALGDLTAP